MTGLNFARKPFGSGHCSASLASLSAVEDSSASLASLSAVENSKASLASLSAVENSSASLASLSAVEPALPASLSAIEPACMEQILTKKLGSKKLQQGELRSQLITRHTVSAALHCAWVSQVLSQK
jgi:hypothetical protein